MSLPHMRGKTIKITGDLVEITGLSNGTAFTNDVSGNIAMGTGSGAGITTGLGNTLYGFQAGQGITTASQNTMVGYRAGGDQVTGNSNVLLGYRAGEAGLSVTSVKIGYDAGRFGPSTQSVNIGFQSGINATANTQNTACGANTMSGTASGTGNNLYGYACGANLTSGTNNCLYGNNCGQLMTTNTNNVGMGNFALQNCTTGPFNTAIGYNAGNAITSASANTLCGNVSGAALTVGSSNTLVGSSAGIAYTTENRNICIFSNGVAADDRTCRIGNSQAGYTLLKTFIGGISGVTPGGAYVATMVDANGQLGVVPCNAERKENFTLLEEASIEKFVQSIPVRGYQYKEGYKGMHIGPNVEDLRDLCDEIYPDFIAKDGEGKEMGFATHLLPWLLVREVQRLQKEINVIKNVTNKYEPQYNVRIAEEEIAVTYKSLKRPLEPDVEPVVEEILEPALKEARVEEEPEMDLT